jgi:precorrin-8X/cobalt-precorrin-8 methylmutase
VPASDISGKAGGETGVVVLGHGSRAPEALVLLNWVADHLAERLEMPVLAASLQFNNPTLGECCRELAAAGARRVVVAPYFLFNGNHLMKDIPEELERLRLELPGTEFILADSLGTDDLLVEVLARRTLAKMDKLGEGDSADRSANDDAADLFAALCNAACGLGDATCGDGGDTAGRSGETFTGGAAAAIARHPIEVESFEIIDSLLEPADAADPEYQVIRRVVHTTGDPSLARAMYFSAAAIGAGVEAIAAAAGIYCDVNMVAAGIQPTTSILGLEVTCMVADPAPAELAEQEGITRGAAAMRLAAPTLDGAIVAIGNSPTALFELLRLVEKQGLRPALVVGVPVGFVGAAESKEALAASAIPCITLPGNRGGSTVAAAIVNALMRLSARGQ